MNEIEIINLKFSYGKKFEPIIYPNIKVSLGNSYAIVGENGCGKTTLLKLILGLYKPMSGEIKGLDDETIGFVPDYNGLYDDMTIIENIKFRLSIYNKNYQEEIARVKELLEKYNLEVHEKKLIKDLSLGMKKKVSIICALLVNPSILILDEPTGGLDIDAQRELAQMLKNYLAEDKMVICTSHDADFLKEIGSEAIFLDKYKKK